MSSRWDRWIQFWDRRETGEALALYRICLGMSLLYALAPVAFSGTAALIWVREEEGGYLPLESGLPWLVEWLGGPSYPLMMGLLGLGILAAVLMVLGAFSRTSAFVGLQVFYALSWTNGHTGGSYDTLMTNALWLAVLADCGATWSFDARWRAGSWSVGRLVAAWPRYLIVVQLVVMYTSTGLQKVSDAWVPGGDFSALYYILQQPTWQRFDMRWAGNYFFLTQVATAGTWLFEVGAPVLWLAFWFRDTRERGGWLRTWFNRIDFRAWFLVFGLTLHAVIHGLMEVGPFSLISMSMYAALVHPDEIRSFFNRFRR